MQAKVMVMAVGMMLSMAGYGQTSAPSINPEGITIVQLVKYGQANKDPHALLTAARLSMKARPGVAKAQAGKAEDEKGFNAEKDFKVADAGKLLDEAASYAGGDKMLLAEIDKTRADITNQKWPCYCSWGYYDYYGWWHCTQWFCY